MIILLFRFGATHQHVNWILSITLFNLTLIYFVYFVFEDSVHVYILYLLHWKYTYLSICFIILVFIAIEILFLLCNTNKDLEQLISILNFKLQVVAIIFEI